MNELKPWYAVATPHKDIREGRLDEAVFGLLRMSTSIRRSSIAKRT